MPLQRELRRGPNVWVVRRGRAYAVLEEDNPHPLAVSTTQRRAIAFAREIAHRNHSELIVQRRIGRIRLKDSYGPDPSPPRG
jgi:hypothetical protein